MENHKPTSKASLCSTCHPLDGSSISKRCLRTRTRPIYDEIEYALLKQYMSSGIGNFESFSLGHYMWVYLLSDNMLCFSSKPFEE